MDQSNSEQEACRRAWPASKNDVGDIKRRAQAASTGRRNRRLAGVRQGDLERQNVSDSPTAMTFVPRAQAKELLLFQRLGGCSCEPEKRAGNEYSPFDR